MISPVASMPTKKCCAILNMALIYKDRKHNLKLQSEQHVKSLTEFLTGQLKLCTDCLLHDEYFEQTNQLLELVLTTAIELINGLLIGSRSDGSISSGDDIDTNWTQSRNSKFLIIQSKLLSLAARVLWFQCPTYVCYRQHDCQHHIRDDSEEIIDMDADQSKPSEGLQFYCNQNAAKCPFLLRNICFFIDSGGMLSIRRLFESTRSTELIPPELAHDIVAIVKNLRTWLNEQTLSALILPLKDLFYRYLFELNDDDLKIAVVHRNIPDIINDVFIQVNDGKFTTVLNTENLKLALKCLSSQIHSLKAGGLTSINNVIRLAENELKSSRISTFDTQLATWLSNNKVIEVLFNANLNLEIVRLSNTLVQFLAERNLLSGDALDCLWLATRRGICGKQVIDMLNAMQHCIYYSHIKRLLVHLSKLKPEEHCEQTIILSANLTRSRWNVLIKHGKLFVDSLSSQLISSDDDENDEDFEVLSDCDNESRVCHMTSPFTRKLRNHHFTDDDVESDDIDEDDSEDDEDDGDTDSILCDTIESDDVPCQIDPNCKRFLDSLASFNNNTTSLLHKIDNAMQVTNINDEDLSKITQLNDSTSNDDDRSPNVSPCRSVSLNRVDDGDDNESRCDKELLDQCVRDSPSAKLKRNGSNSETSLKDFQNNIQPAVDKKRQRLLINEDVSSSPADAMTCLMDKELHVLWNILQDDRVSGLSEKMRIEIESILAQVVTSSHCESIIISHFETCIQNIESNTSVAVSIRLLARILASAEQTRVGKRVFGSNPVLSTENKYSIVDKLLNCLDSLSKKHQSGYKFPLGLENEVSSCLQLLSYVFSPVTPCIFQLTYIQVCHLWDAFVNLPLCFLDLLCDWILEQYDFDKQHGLSLSSLPFLLTNKLIILVPSKVSVKVFSLFIRTYHMIKVLYLQKSDNDQCIGFAFNVLFNNSNQEVASDSAQFISAFFMSCYQQGNFASCQRIVDPCLRKIESCDISKGDLSNNISPSIRAINLLFVHLDQFARRFSMLVPYDTTDYSNPLSIEDLIELRLRVNSTHFYKLYRHPSMHFGRLRAEIIEWYHEQYPSERNCRIRIKGFRGPKDCDDMSIRDIDIYSVIEVDRLDPRVSTCDTSKTQGCYLNEWDDIPANSSSGIAPAMNYVERRQLFSQCCLQYTYEKGKNILIDFASSLDKASQSGNGNVLKKCTYNAIIERVRCMLALLPGRLILSESKRLDGFDMIDFSEIQTQVVKSWFNFNEMINYCYYSPSSKPIMSSADDSHNSTELSICFTVSRKANRSLVKALFSVESLPFSSLNDTNVQCLYSAIRLAMIHDCLLDPTKSPSIENNGSCNPTAMITEWRLTCSESSQLITKLTHIQTMLAKCSTRSVISRNELQISIGSQNGLLRATMILLQTACKFSVEDGKGGGAYLTDRSNAEWLYSLMSANTAQFRQDTALCLFSLFSDDNIGQLLYMLADLMQRSTDCHTTQTFILLKVVIDRRINIEFDLLICLIALSIDILSKIGDTLNGGDRYCAFINLMFSLTRSAMTSGHTSLPQLDELFSKLIKLYIAPPMCHVENLTPTLKETILETILDLALTSPSRYELLTSVFEDMRMKMNRSFDFATPLKDDEFCTTSILASVQYVGIINLSATCYLASCMQQLFMIPEFRSAILTTNAADVCSKHFSLFVELQYMFAYLQFSRQRAFSPHSFCKSYIVENQQPLNVCEQRDMTEFYTDMLSKVEEMSDSLSRTVKSLFVGSMRNQTISADCEHVSSADEQFTFIQAVVADVSSLEESLQRSILCEILEGDNLYYCVHCKKSVRAKRQTGYSKLPKIFAINTLRYSFNLMTSIREKINSRFSFPPLLDMSPYLINENDDVAAPIGKKRSPCWYALVGVTIHAGNSDVGHYYSFIRERTLGRSNDDDKVAGGEARWLWFNDSDVKQFDPRRVPSECFGGDLWSFQYDHSENRVVDCSMEKVNSAYMLFYERLDQENFQRKPSQWLLRGSDFKFTCDQSILNRIYSENQNLAIKRLMFDNSDTAQFIWDLCSSMLTNCSSAVDGGVDIDSNDLVGMSAGGNISHSSDDSSDDINVPATVELILVSSSMTITFLFDWYIYYSDIQSIFKYLGLVNKQMGCGVDNSMILCVHLAHLIVSKPWAYDIFTQCPNVTIRQLFQGLLILLLNTLGNFNIMITGAGFSSGCSCCVSSCISDQRQHQHFIREVGETSPYCSREKAIKDLISMLVNIADTESLHLPSSYDQKKECTQQQPWSYRKVNKVPCLSYMSEYFNVMTNVTFRLSDYFDQGICLDKILSLIGSLCTSNNRQSEDNSSILNQCCSNSCSACSGDACICDFDESSLKRHKPLSTIFDIDCLACQCCSSFGAVTPSPASPSSLLLLARQLDVSVDEQTLNAIVKLLSVLLTHEKARCLLSTNGVKLIQLIDIIAYLCISPWGSGSSNRTSSLLHNVRLNTCIDISMLIGLIGKCLNIGGKPAADKYIKLCVKHLLYNRQYHHYSSISSSVSQFLQIISGILLAASSSHRCSDSDVNSCSSVSSNIAPADIGDEQWISVLHALINRLSILLLRIDPLQMLIFLESNLSNDSKSLDIIESQTHVSLFNWARCHLSIWVRSLLISHDEQAVREKAKNLLLCCTKMEELKTDSLLSCSSDSCEDSGCNNNFRPVEPVRLRMQYDVSVLNDTFAIVEFVLKLVSEFDTTGDDVSSPQSPSSADRCRHKHLPKQSTKNRDAIDYEPAEFEETCDNDLDEDENSTAIDSSFIEENLDQAFEYLTITSQISTRIQNLFTLYCRNIWRIFQLCCRDTTKIGLKNRLSVHWYIYNCIKEYPENITALLSKTDAFDDMINVPILLNHEERDLIAYTKMSLYLSYACILQCCKCSKRFCDLLIMHQILAWSIKFILFRSNLFQSAAQQVLAIIKFLLTSPTSQYDDGLNNTSHNETTNSISINSMSLSLFSADLPPSYTLDTVELLKSQILKVIFPCESLNRNCLLNASIVINYLLNSSYFQIECLVDQIIFELDLPLLSMLANLYNTVDKQLALNMLNKVLPAIQLGKTPICPEIDRLLSNLCMDISKPDVTKCVCSILRMYPQFYRRVLNVILGEPNAILPSEQRLLRRILVHNTNQHRPQQQAPSPPPPLYIVVQTLCSDRLSGHMSTDERTTLALHVVNFYPEFIFSLRIDDLRKYETFHSWLASLFEPSSMRAIDSLLSADGKLFKTALIAVLEQISSSEIAQLTSTPLNDSEPIFSRQLLEVFLCIMESPDHSSEIQLSEHLLNSIQQSSRPFDDKLSSYVDLSVRVQAIIAKYKSIDEMWQSH
ncbi:hypothetical protein GJ496_007006 [Pomphorhynchus laevis]|nr:hypothetical protein GJ496_007006 [Pomphorhynchus laevis]